MVGQQQRSRHWKDGTGELERTSSQCMEDFPLLKAVKLLYAWRDPPRYDQHRGRMVAGEAKRLSNRERDLFGYDAIVIIAKKRWKELNDRERIKLVWHELNHFEVHQDEASLPARDDHGRIKITLRQHDLNMDRFEDEIAKFGPNSEERVQMKKISRLYKRFKKEVTDENDGNINSI